MRGGLYDLLHYDKVAFWVDNDREKCVSWAMQSVHLQEVKYLSSYLCVEQNVSVVFSHLTSLLIPTGYILTATSTNNNARILDMCFS